MKNLNKYYCLKIRTKSFKLQLIQMLMNRLLKWLLSETSTNSNAKKWRNFCQITDWSGLAGKADREKGSLIPLLSTKNLSSKLLSTEAIYPKKSIQMCYSVESKSWILLQKSSVWWRCDQEWKVSRYMMMSQSSSLRMVWWSRDSNSIRTTLNRPK